MYVYGTWLRPPDIGCVPNEGLNEVSFEEFVSDGRHYWGTASYGRKLTEEELEQYDMEKIKED